MRFNLLLITSDRPLERVQMRAKVTQIALSGGFLAVGRKMTMRERNRSLKQHKILEAGVGIEPVETALQAAALCYK